MALSMTASAPPVPPRAPRFAFAALLCANIALSFGPFLVRTVDVGPVSAAFWRLLLAAPLLFLVARARGQRLSGLPPLLWLMAIIGGLFFAADLAVWHLGIMRTKLANAALFGNISSLLLPLWGMVILRHRPRRMQLLALLLAAIGTALLMGSSYELSPATLAGDLLCILAGTCYTGYILAMQKARTHMGSWATLALSSITGILPLWLTAAALGETMLPGNWTPVVLLALSSQIVGQGLMIYALAWFSPLTVGLTLLLQPMIGALVGWLVYGEALQHGDIAGALAVAGALILVRLPARA